MTSRRQTDGVWVCVYRARRAIEGSLERLLDADVCAERLARCSSDRVKFYCATPIGDLSHSMYRVHDEAAP